MPPPGATIGELTLQYVDLRAKDTRKAVVPVSVPTPLTLRGAGLENNKVVIERMKGALTLDGSDAEDGTSFTIELGGPEHRITTVPTTRARLHLCNVTLEPLQRCCLRLAVVPDPTSPEHSHVSVVLESGRLYVHTTGEGLDQKAHCGFKGWVRQE